MANLNSLKNRISVVRNTRKITNAMQLVSTAKLRKIRTEFASVDAYLNLLQDTFTELMAHVEPRDFFNIFPENKDVDCHLHIVMTSDLGLCGSYNHNIIKLLKTKLRKQDKIIVIGLKGYSMISSIGAGEQIIAKYTEIGEKVSYEIGSLISRKALELYLDKKISKVYFYYTEFINNILQEAVVLKLFPFDIPEMKDSKPELSATIEFEPNSEVVLKNSIPLYLGSMIFGLGTSSKISEMASRRNAMENATKNADDLVKDLMLQFNRKRQSNITQEINEIVAGADAT
ncbi:ATP synthase F1 subunit gamma [Mycoplasmopsis verecunda]|uniref:ATP synthase gamma chain n=1 Tax=Mycoplasmopsis verecunda TaxID=171291 RepID=A0A1T4KKJ4_9BACT|nr:ATP synthase F1 subunit gamma [Mycoplasmopsis verecunda]WPB54264.1 ATP synthase F1 subunit gamma [Mycoplasmopsis verecunda]SJZ42897.1 F-type H+-transporting ATPase subunit gamma [Mycoplasmopsis verecunda]